MDFDLIKARPHKYVKRTGSPGSYKYWYKLPDGRLVSSDDAASPVPHGEAKKEHLMRLVLGKMAGHHSMTAGKMAEHTGMAENQARNAIANHTRRAGARGDHGFEPHELQNAHLPEEEHITPSTRAPTPAAAVPASPRRSASRARTAAAEAASVTRKRPRITGGDAQSRDARAAEAEAARPAIPPSRPGEHDDHHLRTAGFTKMHYPIGSERWVKHTTGGQVEITKDGSAYKIKHSSEGGEEKTVEGTFDAFTAARKGVSIANKITRDHRAARRATDEIRDANAAHASERSSRASTAFSTQRPRENASVPRADARVAAANTAVADTERKIKELRAKLAREHGVNLDPTTPAVANASAERARAAAQRAASPSSAAARELHEADPALAAADEPIRRMESTAAAGGNPYLERAKEIYENIQGDLKPERRTLVGHVMNAIQHLQDEGKDLNEANLVQKYKDLSGSRIRGISGISDEFEKGTFMSLDEVMGNKPLDIEVERMKRGYAAKQFARMKPFLKDAFNSSNPGAPPPMPTFGDVKSWGDHGGPKPSWAGTTRLAMPKDVHDAAVKGPDGKPQYPPAWMPIHLMPVWNYIAKSSQAGGNNPYQTPAANFQGGKVSVGNQARYQEGHAISALRKYVQMRGGPDQLVDIPKHKLSESGLTHSDIFKAEKKKKFNIDTDEGLHEVIKHKIVDPCSLMPFIKEQMHTIQKSVPSFSLVVDDELPPVNFKKSYTIELQKSELIKKIKALKQARA